MLCGLLTGPMNFYVLAIDVTVRSKVQLPGHCITLYTHVSWFAELSLPFEHGCTPLMEEMLTWVTRHLLLSFDSRNIIYSGSRERLRNLQANTSTSQPESYLYSNNIQWWSFPKFNKRAYIVYSVPHLWLMNGSVEDTDSARNPSLSALVEFSFLFLFSDNYMCSAPQKMPSI